MIRLALLAAAAARVISCSSGPGIVTLLVIGAVLLISPFVISHVERLSTNAGGYELQLTREIAELGAPNAARVLDRSRLAQVRRVLRRRRPGTRRRSRSGTPRRTLQDLLVQRAAALAHQEKFEAAEVRTLFANGSPELRSSRSG